MKRLTAIILTAALAVMLLGCAASSAENTDFTAQYLPEGVEFIKAEKDDGFTEYKYRDADKNKYTLIADSADNVRALEFDSNSDPTAAEVILTEEDAFSVIKALYPEAELITAVDDRDDGGWEWNILFADGSDLLFYELDAANGDILGYDIFYGLSQPIDPGAIISANIPGAEILEIGLDTDDGRVYIEGEARTSTGVVEFSIDADTGIIVKAEYDD